MFATNLKKLDVMKVLLASGADINQRDYSGCTALHFLAGSKSSGRERIIPFLLHNGADIHMPDKKGNYRNFIYMYSKTSMARISWNHENMFEAGVVRGNELTIAPGQFFSMKVCCEAILMSTHNIPFSI